jgi:hypothetical protein
MKRRRDLLIGVTFLVVFASLAIGERILETRVVAEAAGVQAPLFEVDPLWPKPLPNHWVMGNTIGVSADAHCWTEILSTDNLLVGDVEGRMAVTHIPEGPGSASDGQFDNYCITPP